MDFQLTFLRRGTGGNFLLIYICNSHVFNLLLIYIRKLHWDSLEIPRGSPTHDAG